MNPKPTYWQQLRLDNRSLSLFRIILGLSLLYNLWIKSYYLKEFWGENPIIPQAVFQALNGANAFSIFDLIRSDLFAQTYFVLCFISFSLLTLGFRTRWTAAISCFLYWNLLQASASFAFGFDLYTFQLLFWACFLPLNQYWKLDFKQKTAKQANLIFSIILLYQIAWIYFATGIAKYGDSWLQGYAVQNMLLDQWATTDLGQYLANQAWFYMPATYLSLFFECIFPLLIFLPFKRLRYLASGFLFIFHLSILLTYHVANFSISGFAVAVLLLPADFWKKLQFQALQNPSPNIQNRYLKYLSYGLCGLAFVVISSKNIYFASRCSPLRKTAFAKTLNIQLPYLEPVQLVRVSFFTQYWRMFAPNPPFKVGWIALEIEEEDQAYDLFSKKRIREQPQINWSPQGLEYYLMMYARTFNFPSGQGERYKVFLKYWIPYQLKKHNIPLSRLDDLRLVEYQYYVKVPPHPTEVSRDPYRARKLVEQDLTKLRIGHKFKKE
jgi:hypothetical protein